MNRIRQKNLEDISKFTVIPDGWKEVTIQEVCNIGRGRVISQEEIKSNLGIYPVYSSQTRNNGRMGSIDTYDFDGEFITWTTDGENAGTVFHRLGKFNCTNVCGTLTAKDDEVDHSFLSYHLGRIAKSYVSYIGNPKLMNGVMGDIGLILPPLDEQQKIAKILRTVDNLIEKTQTLIEKYTAIKQGMMADLFTRGIDMTTGDTPNPKGGKLRPSVEDAPELYKQTELGWVPKEWEVKKFKDITDVLTCGVAATPVYVDEGEGYTFLSARNVKKGRVDLTKVSYIPEWLHIQLTKYNKPKLGDILYSRVGAGYGEAAVVEIDIDFSVYVSLTHIRMKSGLDSYFYKFLLNTHQVKNRASIDVFQGGGVPNLNVTEVREFKLPVPSLKEQILISEKLKLIEEHLLEHNSLIDKYKKQKKGLMQDLLTGKVRVN